MKDCFNKFTNPHLIKKRETVLLFNAIFFIVLFLLSCADKPGKQNKKLSAKTNQKTVWTEKDEIGLKNLFKKFNSTKDAANNIVWYSHKSIPTAETNIHAEVNGTDNYCYLISMSCGKNPFLYDSVQIKLGEDILSTKKISASDRRNRRSNYKGLFFGTIHFTEGTDNNIPGLIALNHKKNIIVKLIGQKQYYEYALSNKLKKSIKDAYELTQQLKKKSSAL